jgi:glutaredoxin domain-containing cysteine-rich protein 1
MGCKGSKHALHGGCGLAARAPEPQSRSGRLAPRHSVVALRSSTLGTLSLDRAVAAVAAAGLSFDAAAAAGGGGGGGVDEATTKAGDDDVDGAGTKLLGPSRSFGGWRPTTPPPVAAPPKRQRRAVVAASKAVAPPRTPNETPARNPDPDPEEIDVWELMNGLEDEDEEADDGAERKARSAPASPALVPEILDAFRKALDDLTPDDSPSPLPRFVKPSGTGGAEKREIQTFPGIVRARVDVFQEKINTKTTKLAAKAVSLSPPESAGRVVVYLTSLRGIRQTYEDCRSTSAVLQGYGVRVDERDLSMHAGFKHELRAALGVGDGDEARRPPLPQVFADGRHLGGAEEVRRLHEAGDLASALGACDAAPCAAGAQDACAGCGGVRFVPCGGCSGSCKVFVDDEGGSGAGAFRRCPECNENGLVKCAVC